MNDESPDLQTSAAPGEARTQPDVVSEPAAAAKKKRSKVSAKAATAAIEARIGHKFADADLLATAFTHVSALKSSRKRGDSYQRLEFLGDHVLGLVVSDMLYRAFPNANEGELSKRLADLVRKESCADVAKSLGLIDDIGRLSPRVKLLVQVTAVFLMMKSGIRIRIEAFPPLLCVALTFLWMIVMTNGFNLIDVMDGLAAGVATVSSLALTVVFHLQGNRMGLILSLSLVGTLKTFPELLPPGSAKAR